MKKRSIAVVAAALTTAGLTAPAGAQTPENSDVYVVHGVPGVTVDVYVEGALTLEDFEPSTVAGPLSLPAGDYDIEVFAAADGPTEATSDLRADAPAIVSEDTAVPAGANVSLVAHYVDDSTLALSPFVNDVSATTVPNGRLEVRHAASAPEVDIVAGGAAVAPFTELVTGDAEAAVLPAGDYPTGIAATGTTDVLVEAPVTVERGVYTIVYAVGRFGGATPDFALVIQKIGGIYLDGEYAGSEGLDASIARLYVAILGRQPDAAGFEYWKGIAADNDNDLVALVFNMAESAEFDARFGDVFGGENEIWVEHLYEDILGRDSDSAGQAYWLAEIEAGRLTQETALLYFSESDEYKVLTGTE